ncbi:MAG: hypothetical protein ACK4WC_09005 [Rubrimonas sp.]
MFDHARLAAEGAGVERRHFEAAWRARRDVARHDPGRDQQIAQAAPGERDALLARARQVEHVVSDFPVACCDCPECRGRRAAAH